MALLEVRNVKHSFGGVAALDGVTFALEPGRIKAIIGPNGAGKTTLFNLISGTVRSQSGEIRFDGRSIGGLPPHRIARLGVSRTFQNLCLFMRMSVIENVMVGRHLRTRCGLFSASLRLPRQRAEERAIREAAMAALDRVGLADAAKRPVASLSFGKRRMVELARALATEPRLLLLDEPASGLNTKETDELAGLIARIRDGGVTLLLVEHDMSLVMDVSEEILVLHYGTPIAEGPPASIRSDARVVEVYLGKGFDSASR